MNLKHPLKHPYSCPNPDCSADNVDVLSYNDEDMDRPGRNHLHFAHLFCNECDTEWKVTWEAVDIEVKAPEVEPVPEPEPDETELECPICNGRPAFMGALGTTTWFRCRNCGIDIAVGIRD